MENYKLNRYSRQLLVLYFSSTQISIVIEKMVYFKLREAKYSSSIVLASNGPFLTKYMLHLHQLGFGTFPRVKRPSGRVSNTSWAHSMWNQATDKYVQCIYHQEMSIQTQHSKNHQNRTRYGQGMPQTLCTTMLCNASAHLLKHIPLQFRPSEEHFLSLPQFWTEFHDFFCILFGFASTVQICIVPNYLST